MLTMFHKPYNMLMFSMLLFGIAVSLSAENWLTIWMGLEINLYCFLPMILSNSKNQEKEAAAKYFITQAIASAMIMFAFLEHTSVTSYTSSLMFMGLIIKIGVAPGHFWLPSVMNAISWWLCWVLSSIQKLAPMMMIMCVASFSPLMSAFCAGASSIVGGILGLNQTLFRVLLAYSSIGHMGWVLAASMVNKQISMFYFICYLLIITSLFFFMDYLKSSSGNFMKMTETSPIFLVSFSFMFISLSGLPPFLGFFPKLMTLKVLMEAKLLVLMIFMVIGSVMNMYYYLKMIFIMMTATHYPIFTNGSLRPLSTLLNSLLTSMSIISSILLLNLFTS
uniref:NADH-ubiquinone oxidoreductase chain 2 n=1 Tax=Decemunciger sp. AB-2017 TaxID=1980157 RepID=A0A1X9ZNP8_9ANNE